jgi:Flp pilus assembly pilin Flp
MEQLNRHLVNLAEDGGQTMAEYGLILAGVFLAVATVLVLLGDPVTGLISGVVNIYP